MSTLGEGLDALADRVPPATPPPDLWARGRRWGRRRRAGTALVVGLTVLALLGVGVTGWLRARPVTAPYAAGPAEPLRLPDRLHEAGAWLPDVAEDGPLGPVSAVLEAQRGRLWGGPTPDLVGVSSATGAYRFLDLPGWRPTGVDDGSAARLSADGTLLAYAYDDGTHPASSEGGSPGLAGVAVYDTTSGEVVARRPVPSEHGIGLVSLLWAGDRLWAGWSTWDDDSHTSARQAPTLVWDPATGEEVRPDPLRPGPDLAGATAAGSSVVRTGPRALRVVRPAGDDVRTTAYRLDTVVTGAAVLSPDGRRVAVLADADGDRATSDAAASAVLVGRLPAPGGTVRLDRVGDVTAGRVVAWRDPTQVVVEQYAGAVVREVGVDVVTGRTDLLTRVGALASWQVAADAWRGPTFAAPAPQQPLDPRLVGGLVVGLLGLGAAGVLVWRRRVRP